MKFSGARYAPQKVTKRRGARGAALLAAGSLVLLASCASDSGDSSPATSAPATTLAAATTTGASGGSGSTAASTTAGTTPDTPTEIVVPNPGQATSYARDGGSVGGGAGSELALNTQATLIRYKYVDDPDTGAMRQDWGEFEGLLADSYDVSPDGLTYIFHLKEGVMSPAGNELTADDVLWSFERKWASKSGPSKSGFAPILTDPATQITKVDDHTVAFKLDRAGYGFTFLGLMANSLAPIYDSDMLKEHVTADDPYAIEWSKTNPNWGFGAYTVESKTEGEETVLVANPNYVLGKPAIDKITYRVVQDAGTRATTIRNGDADVAEQLQPADIADLADANGVQTFSAKTNAFLRVPLVTNKAPFDDPKVRQAFAYAVPYQDIIDNVYSGDAQPMVGLLNGQTPGYDGTGLEGFTFDPAKAKALLAEAGHPDGVEFSLSVSSAVPDAVAAAVVIQSFAQDAGFKVTIDERPAADFATATNEGTLQAFIGRDFPVVMSPSYMLSVWTNPGSPQNWAKWEDPAFYAAIDAGLAIADPLSPDAAAQWNAAEQVMQTEVPFVFICTVSPDQVFSSDITGYAHRSDNYLDFSVMSAG